MESNQLIQKVDELKNIIYLIDANTKHSQGLIIGVISILLAGAALGFFWYVKFTVNKVIEFTVNKRFDEMISSNNCFEVITGQINIIKQDLVNNKFRFQVTNKEIYINPDSINKIIITSIKGNRVLKYTARIKAGEMVIRFKNYNPKTDQGIRWKIIYLTE